MQAITDLIMYFHKGGLVYVAVARLFYNCDSNRH